MAPSSNEKLRFVKSEGIIELLLAKVSADALPERFLHVAEYRPIDVHQGLRSIPRAKLIALVNDSPEILASDVEELFEEYRYGDRPGFTLFLTEVTPGHSLDEDAQQVIRRLASEGAVPSDENTWGLRVLDFDCLRPAVHEITFSYQVRRDYIDPETEEPRWHAELEFGFAWVGLEPPFLAVESCPDSISQGLQNLLGATGIRALPLKFDRALLESIVPHENLKRGGFRLLSRSGDEPEVQRYGDSRLGELQLIKDLDERAERTTGLYEQQVDESTSALLGFNLRLGRFYLSKRLRASQLRQFALDLVQELIAACAAVMGNASSSGTVHFQLDEAWSHLPTGARPMLDELALALARTKRDKLTSCPISLTVRQVFEAMPRSWLGQLIGWCDRCDSDAILRCHNCGEPLGLTGNPMVIGCSCVKSQSLSDFYVICSEDHFIKAPHAAYELTPMHFLVERFSVATRLVPGAPFNPSEDAFRLRDETLLFATTGVRKVRYEPEEIPELARVSANSSQDDPGTLRLIRSLPEKCPFAAKCAGCNKSDLTQGCLINLLRAALGVTPHPHQGHEYGDFMLQVTLESGAANLRGLAKRGGRSRSGNLTLGSTGGDSLIRQACMAAVDARSQVIAVCAPCRFDNQVIAMLEDICRTHGKKLVVLDESFLARAWGFAEGNLPEGRAS